MYNPPPHFLLLAVGRFDRLGVHMVLRVDDWPPIVPVTTIDYTLPSGHFKFSISKAKTRAYPGSNHNLVFTNLKLKLKVNTSHPTPNSVWLERPNGFLVVLFIYFLMFLNHTRKSMLEMWAKLLAITISKRSRQEVSNTDSLSELCQHHHLSFVSYRQMYWFLYCSALII